LIFLLVYPEEIRRLATIITAFRFVFFAAGALTGLFLLPEQSFIPLFFFAFAGFTDFFDGIVARKTGVTDAGGFLDAETDALAVSLLSLYALGSGHAPPIVLLAGLMRYIFFFPLKRFGKIESSSRYFKLYAKFACAAAVALLTASSAPIWTNRRVFWLASIILLGISFFWELILSAIAYIDGSSIPASEKETKGPEKRWIIGVVSLIILYAGLGAYRWVPEYSWEFLFVPAVEFTVFILILNYVSLLPKRTGEVLIVPVSLGAGGALLFSIVEAFMQHTYRQPFIPFSDIPYLRPLLEMTAGLEISNAAVLAGILLLLLVFSAAGYYFLRRGLYFTKAKPRIASLIPVILIPFSLLFIGDRPLYSRMIMQIPKPGPAIGTVAPSSPDPASSESVSGAGGGETNLDDAGLTYALPGVKDAHLLFCVVESYGNTIFTNPEHRHRITDFYRECEARLGQAGIYYASALLDSPTTGGRSWLAEGSLLSGIRLENQAVYDGYVENGSYTMLDFLESAGYHTVMAAPGTTYLSDRWVSAFPFNEFLIRGDFGYKGPFLSFGAMPDQYLMNFVDSYMNSREKPQPLFLQVLLTTSHTPFDVVPAYVEDWSKLGDGTIFKRLEHRFFDNGWLRGSEYPEGYTGSISYSLKVVTAYVERMMEDGEFVFILGDHQPRLPVRESGAGSEVPIHLFTRDRDLLLPWLESGFVEELFLGEETPVYGMEMLFPLLRDIAEGKNVTDDLDRFVPE
jgi:phosphatidylglycerophosphate synthase